MRYLASFLLCCCSIFANAADDRVSLVFSDIRLVDLARVAFGELAKEPFYLSHDVLEHRQLVGLDLRAVDRKKAVASVRGILEGSGFSVRQKSGVWWIAKAEDAQDELVVYRPRFRSAKYLADVVQSVTGARSVLSRSVRGHEVQQIAISKEIQPAAVPQKSSPNSAEAQIDRSEVDQIAFAVAAKDAGKVQKLLADLDTQPGEVLLKAAVYEVGTDRREGSAFKLAVSIVGGKLGLSLKGAQLDGGSVSFKSGGIEAILSALDSDTRFKSVSRPQVRVRNGGQARFSVGQDVPVLGAAQVDKNGNPVQSVDYKQSGVILTASPEIREDVIELNIQQELSNFVLTKTGVNNSPTLIKRSIATRLGLVPGEVVVIAGLLDNQEDESANRVPFLGWLFGKDRQERSSEILVFIEAQRI